MTPTRFEKVLRSGWGVNMHILPLDGGGTLVYAPTWLGDDTFERVDSVGEPRILLAPNHFHNRALVQYRERYPNARMVAADGALPRLRKRGHVLDSVSTVRDELGDIGLLFPDGLKTGEVWLELREPDGRSLLFCDSFMNVLRSTTGLVGWFLRVSKTAPGLCVPGTLGPLHISNRKDYVRSAKELIRAAAPIRLRFTHGEPLDLSHTDGTSTQLVDQLIELLDRRL